MIQIYKYKGVTKLKVNDMVAYPAQIGSHNFIKQVCTYLVYHRHTLVA